MPGMDDYEFDSEQDAEDNEEDEEDIDIDGFFTDIPANTKVSNKTVQKNTTKQRPPSILGDEQRKMYQELNEISELAPERNDQHHMEHLCQFWMEREAEEIMDKKFTKDFLEENLKDDDEKEKDHKMERKQRQAL